LDGGVKKLLAATFVALLMVGCGGAISAVEPVRTWTDLKGATIKAGFVQFADEKVIIRREDGVSFNVSPAIFSEKDMKYLEEMRKKLNQVGKAAPEAPVHFNDAKLEAALREVLEKPAAPLTRRDMASLKEFKALEKGITDLSGLEHATELTGLNLANNQITDISPLAGLTKLATLYLSNNRITDDQLGTLAKLAKLTILFLPGNLITNVTPLAGLTELTDLGLSDNNITDLTRLAELVNLSDLTLYNNQITDISPLAGLMKLETLSLEENKITDLTPLAGLAKLTELFLNENKITDLTPLKGLAKLVILFLNDNKITDAKPLVKLTKLEGLLLGNNPITADQQAMLRKALPNCDIEF
jgi:phage terminase large subunit-like protein